MWEKLERFVNLKDVVVFIVAIAPMIWTWAAGESGVWVYPIGMCLVAVSLFAAHQLPRLWPSLFADSRELAISGLNAKVSSLETELGETRKNVVTAQQELEIAKARITTRAEQLADMKAAILDHINDAPKIYSRSAAEAWTKAATELMETLRLSAHFHLNPSWPDERCRIEVPVAVANLRGIRAKLTDKNIPTY